MGVSIVFGGQFGSEGKGKVARYFAQEYGASSVVRVGGINSGHTVISDNGEPIIFRTLPTAVLDNDVNCILPAGSYLDLNILFAEIDMVKLNPKRLKIHPNAVVITKNQVIAEKNADLGERVGSTLTGMGGAVAMRVMRDKGLVMAKDVKELSPYICDTADFLRGELLKGHEVLIEGTQGYGLSNLHSSYYPYATSRDTSAAGFLSEAGLSPFDVKHIIMVMRSYPIRVAGQSGPLRGEISWAEVTARSGRDVPIKEYTSVTLKERRVALFDENVILQSIICNKPDRIVLNHLDYLPGDGESISAERMAFVSDVEKSIGQKIGYVGLGPDSILAL